ncbi:N-6 DNA methylase [Clostridium estertheticum]|uniref:site-specific DNA-methyltransferase (adenine-specific) n=1 Tax=Clostridium estertheticum TaxID=238834 RepID=A0A7Y3T0B7_9CLOT|nr:N-6 DNA methylase [Clostridium estertheticum]MBW9173385.1 N-6 DNA methylase [Clostridium estertheticum]NNU78370.1 N-6 DNA methylase [Clostridium estertheticum]WBL45276.1 N-6 DNA methylase [Clostridium estertheticum]WLC77278.1 N-6 DNA methylase [Clostridium estertheticum]
MEKVLKFNSSISDLLRNDYRAEELDIIVAKYYGLGYCSLINKIGHITIDTILRSSDIRKEVEKGFALIEGEVSSLNGVFKYLVNDNKMSDKTYYQLLSLIKSVNFSKEEWRYAFEDMLSRINEAVGRAGAETRTPNCLNRLGIRLLEPHIGSFYDGAAGLNSTLIEASEFGSEYGGSLKLYGQEIKPVTWAIGKIRLFINGIEDAEVKLGNTLEKPLFTEGNNQVKQFDNIMMNFPFGLAWNKEDASIEKDVFNRFIFGKPTRSSSEWLFISHIIKSLKEQGKAIAITTSGTLFRGAADAMVRENIIVSDCIEAVISLPSSLFKTTAIPVNMIVININKEEILKDKILFINGENMYENLNKTQKTLAEEHIDKIVDAYKKKQEIEEFSIIIHRKDLEENNLLPSRYVMKAEINTDYFGKVKFNKEKLMELKKCKTLGDIGEFYRGINVIGENVQDENGEYKIINLADVKDGEIDIEALGRYTIKNNARVEAYRVEEGDIIISIRGTSIKICIIPKHEGKVLLSQNFIGIRIRWDNSPEYIKEFLESPLGQFLIASKQAGTSIITLNPKDLKQIPVVLLSIEEQLSTIKTYKDQEIKLRNEIVHLQNKIKEIKLDLYAGMGIREKFIITKL